MSKYTENEYLKENRPDVEVLCERVTQWRQEIGVKTRPDMERLEESLILIQKGGLGREFVLFVIVLCEWSFRVRFPISRHIRRALMFKLNQQNYTPYSFAPFLMRIRTRNVPTLVDDYVDACLQKLWNQQSVEQSRIFLRDRVDKLVQDFATPFRAAGLVPLKPKRGGYPWQAPWAASAIIYELLRSQHPRKRDSLAIDATLELATALLGRLPDQSQFHRKRREILSLKSDFPQWLENQYKNFTVLRELTVSQLLKPNFDMSLFTISF